MSSHLEQQAEEIFIARRAASTGQPRMSVREQLKNGGTEVAQAFAEFRRTWTMANADCDMGEPACTPRVQPQWQPEQRPPRDKVLASVEFYEVDGELLRAEEVNESWQMSFNLGSVIQSLWLMSATKADRLGLLENAQYYLDREIDRERKLRE